MNFPATSYGKLHYCTTENLGHFNTKMALTPVDVTAELNLWINNMGRYHMPIFQPEIDLQLETDASLEGWAATDHHTADGKTLKVTALTT